MLKSDETAGVPSPKENALAPVLVETIRDLAHVRAEAANLKSERDTFRMMVQQAFHELHDLTATIGRQRETIVRLHELIREYVEPRPRVGRAA